MTTFRVFILALLIAALAAAVFGRGAFATDAATRTVDMASVQRQVADLNSQVKALTGQVNALKTRFKKQEQYDQAIYDSETCISTLTADAFQGTWLGIDKLAQPTLNTTFFGSMSPVDDRGGCSGFNITRSILQLPPNIGGFQKMIGWLQG